MWARYSAGLIAVACVMFASGVVAQPELMSLRNNPFDRPEILNAPPPAPSTPTVTSAAAIPPEEVVLVLTATMVSDNAPMVVVDGERLAVGEKIEGFKLVAVMEGKAVFTRAGKKYSFMIVDEQSQYGDRN